MSEENTAKLDLGAIDFTPDWAKKGAGVTVGKISEQKPRAEEADGKSARKFGERKPYGEKKPFGGRKQFDRPAQNPRGNFQPRRERPRPMDVSVQILPETKALGTIIRKLQQDTHAYKLKELANFFLNNPSSVLLKITSKNPQEHPLSLWQCKACGFASDRQEEVIEHITSAHLSDYYDLKEIEVEPPTGNFNSVAKCGLSGVLLGPPNIHEFNTTVREMIRTRYPEMSEEQYRANIVIVRDQEAIEEWRKSATKRMVFTPKGAGEDAIPLSREQAEGEFKRTIMPNLIEMPKHLMITAEMALKLTVKPLVWAVRDALEAEHRAPYNMCFALRGAFHHRKLKFFRANDARGPEFVSNMEYREFDAEHAIPELASAAKFITENPCCDKSEFANDGEMEKHLNWLVTTGHVVAFTNGVYSMYEKFPKYGPQWKRRANAEKASDTVAAEPPLPMPEAEPVAVVSAAEEVTESAKEAKDEEVKDEPSVELAE